jgi:hypothetical protein
MSEMTELKCSKCNTSLCLGRDTEGDLVQFSVICVCGTRTVFEFIGYPRLCANHEYSFNFTDEEEITCQKR